MSNQQQTNQWTIRDTSRGKEREAESRAEAEETKSDLIQLGANASDIEIVPPNTINSKPSESVEEENEETDGERQADVVEPSENGTEQRETSLPDNPPSVEEDPVDWMPDHFIDKIQGVPTVNKKGYAVIAAQYNVSVKAEPITLASETENKSAEFQAIAHTENGAEYSGFGSANVGRGDDEYLLNELAETRAMKRATAWATGLGITAVEEMVNDI